MVAKSVCNWPTPGWEPKAWWIPRPFGAVGQFLINDVALLGAAIWSLGKGSNPEREADHRTLNTREDNAMQTAQSDYFSAYRQLKLTRDAKGVLVAEFHSNGGPCIMNAQGHTEFVDAFYRIAQDRANKIVILTGAGGDFIINVDWSSFGDVSDPGVWSQVHDEGVQVLENIANIRVPVIAAIEGRAYVHSDYVLLGNVIVAGESATFQDVAHYAVGVAPGDGIFTTWSYRAGAGRAEAFLLDHKPLPARTAQEWGVVAEVVPNGRALNRARELDGTVPKSS
jgi:enoyl-CoA hydratase/carnithine racemase